MKMFTPIFVLALLITVLAGALVLHRIDNRPARPLPKAAVAPPGTSEQTAQALPSQFFVRTIMQSEILAIEWSKLALEKSSTQGIRTLAQMVIDDNTKASDTLRAVAQSIRGIRVAAELPEGQKQNLSTAGSLAGAQLDRRYRAAMVRIHDTAVTAVRAYAENGDNANLKKWAEVNLPVLRDHLQTAQDLPGSFHGIGVPRRVLPRVLHL